jgi:hypothetical protein
VIHFNWGWPLAAGDSLILREYSDERLKLAQFLGQLGVFLTLAGGAVILHFTARDC